MWGGNLVDLGRAERSVSLNQVRFLMCQHLAQRFGAQNIDSCHWEEFQLFAGLRTKTRVNNNLHELEMPAST